MVEKVGRNSGKHERHYNMLPKDTGNWSYSDEEAQIIPGSYLGNCKKATSLLGVNKLHSVYVINHQHFTQLQYKSWHGVL